MFRRSLLLLLGLGSLVASFVFPEKPVPYIFPKLTGFPPMPQSAANPVTEEGAMLGRMLFYDPILSRDSTMSCASCHRQEAAFSDALRRFSKDRLGAPLERNTLPLFNLAWYTSFFWDGRAGSLEAQAFQPVSAHREMNLSWKVAVERLRKSHRYRKAFKDAFGTQAMDSVHIAYAIAQFERTLLSYRSKYDRALRGEVKFNHAEAAGFEIMSDLSMSGCFPCHDFDGSALGVVPGFSNNGLDSFDGMRDKGRNLFTGKSVDRGAFKIPSLRNIALTPPYMHDGRFQTLEEVLEFYQKGIHADAGKDNKMGSMMRNSRRLTAADIKNVLAFLHTLTDSALIADPKLSNPWK